MDNTINPIMNYLSFTDSPEALVHKQVFNGYVKTRPVWNFSDTVDVKVAFLPLFLSELVCMLFVYYTNNFAIFIWHVCSFIKLLIILNFHLLDSDCISFAKVSHNSKPL